MNGQWKLLAQLVEIRSTWLTLIGERYEDQQQQVLDYWRVEKADSVIIITIHKGQFLLPLPSYRPGLQKTTLDFPGGRVPEGKTPTEVVPAIVRRELGLSPTKEVFLWLQPLNQEGWAVNSSFSNQKLYGFAAELLPSLAVNPEVLGATYATTEAGIKELLTSLTCLQCRAVLQEFWQQLKTP